LDELRGSINYALSSSKTGGQRSKRWVNGGSWVFRHAYAFLGGGLRCFPFPPRCTKPALEAAELTYLCLRDIMVWMIALDLGSSPWQT
jgi:hypothetical protein